MKADVAVGGKIFGKMIEPWASQEERFESLASFVEAIVTPGDFAVLEGYSYGSKGAMAEIGENTGLMKNRLWRLGVSFEIAAPTTIKKHGAGTGKADKDVMIRAFEDLTGVDIRKTLGMTPSATSPGSDVVDSFFACSFAHKKKFG